MGELTDLLLRANAGDEAARQQLFASAYDELRLMARARLREGGRNTLLDTTVLVHESFLRFVQAGRLQANDRGHFFAYAASVMRSVIVDFARRRQAQRRGGDAAHVTLDTDLASSLAAQEDEVIGVHEALAQLESVDPRLARIVEMRFFAGMGETEIGEALGVTQRTVRRDWERARLLLSAVLRP
ncbi:MAG TPA: ECF-type sigma factor [Burkholderiaceae bacterium]|nr:ECF-type sigma factor [Burkholderiaceae bacterium]